MRSRPFSAHFLYSLTIGSLIGFEFRTHSTFESRMCHSILCDAIIAQQPVNILNLITGPEERFVFLRVLVIPKTKTKETLRLEENKTSCFPMDQSLYKHWTVGICDFLTGLKQCFKKKTPTTFLCLPLAISGRNMKNFDSSSCATTGATLVHVSS